MADKKELWMVAALDAIAQFRATKEPLKNLVKRICTQRRLGPRERTKMSEAAFAWSRFHEVDNEKLILGLKRKGIARPTIRQLDEALIENWMSCEGELEADFPEWFVKRITNDYKSNSLDLLESLKERAGPSLAIDPRYLNFSDLRKALDASEIEYKVSPLVENALRVTKGRFRIESLPKKMQRHVWIMDEASQFAAAQVNCKETGEFVLDCCAGGGGKSQYLISRGAHVVAMDISERRLLAAKKRCAAEGEFVVADAREPPYQDGSFDWIFLDAPCTGTGTLRRAPDLLQRITEADIEKFVILQREIMQGVSRLLKPGATLIYATCSLFAEENIGQAHWAQKELGLSLIETRQLLPSQDETDGFFVARFIQKGVRENA